MEGISRATAPRHGWRTGLEAEQGAAGIRKTTSAASQGILCTSESQLAFLYSGPDRKGPSGV